MQNPFGDDLQGMRRVHSRPRQRADRALRGEERRRSKRGHRARRRCYRARAGLVGFSSNRTKAASEAGAEGCARKLCLEAATVREGATVAGAVVTVGFASPALIRATSISPCFLTYAMILPCL